MQFTGSLKHLRNNTISPIKNQNHEIQFNDLHDIHSYKLEVSNEDKIV